MPSVTEDTVFRQDRGIELNLNVVSFQRISFHIAAKL